MKTVIYKTQDQRALTWWRGYQDRHRKAIEKLTEFGAAITPLIGPCEHGNDRHQIAYTTAHLDEVSIIGALAEHHDLEQLPGGMLLHNGIMRGDPGTSTGLRFIDLAEEYSSSRLMEDIDSIGILSRVQIDGGLQMPGVGFDPITDTLFQYWPKRGDLKRAVKSAIDRSGVLWIKSTDSELETVKARAKEMSIS